MSQEQPTDSQNAGRIISQLRRIWEGEVDCIVLEGKKGKRTRAWVEREIRAIDRHYTTEIDVYRQILHNAEHGKVDKEAA